MISLCVCASCNSNATVILSTDMLTVAMTMSTHPMRSCVEGEIKRSFHGKVAKSSFKVHPIFSLSKSQ